MLLYILVENKEEIVINLVDFIMTYYPWIIIISIIILLAVIGYYADKTNFGQQISDDEEKENLDEEILKDDILVNQEVNTVKKETKINKKEKSIKKMDIKHEQNSKKNLDKKDLDQYDKFDKEFDEVLPEKEIIDDDLLNDIDSLSLDKTQKISVQDIPDLDNIELPEIKLQGSSKKKDLWNKK